MTTNYRSIKNMFAIAGFIALVYIMYSLLGGSLIREKLYGTWMAVEIYDEITFEEKTYTRGRETGQYIIRGNQIIFSNGKRYKIILMKHYLKLNETYYIKE